MTHSHELISTFAERIRRGHTFILGESIVALVKAHKNDPEVSDDCAFIMQKYPMSFPLTAEKATM